MTILVITKVPDLHVEMVQKHLTQELVIFDPSTFPFENDITYKFNDGLFEVDSKGMSLSNASTVWYRKPELVKSEDLPVPDEYKAFTHSCYEKGVTSIYSLLQSAFWVSDYWAYAKATANKPYQAERAYRIGFSIPETLITSVPEEAKNFIQCHKAVITKSIGEQNLGAFTNFMTTRVNSGTNLEGLCVAPAIFQREVKGLDLRITIVGSTVFCVEVHKSGETAEQVDWRYGSFTEDLAYTEHVLPDDVEYMCVALIKDFGLTFGVIDMRIDEDGTYYFLECNPNGQWAFVELEGGLPISQAIAELLECRQA